MRVSEVATSIPAGPFTSLPIRLEQRPGRLIGVAGAVFTALCAVLLITPIGLVAATAADQSATTTIIAERPFIAVQLGVATLAGAFLLFFAGRRISTRVGRDRTVVIESGRVTVFDRGLFGVSIWSEPLASYRGIVQHIRASLSGTRHELILFHGDGRKNILLEMSVSLPQDRVDQTAALLALPEVAPRELSAP